MVANQQRGEVDITVSGKRYILRPSLNALAQVESITGKLAPKIMQEAIEGGVAAMIALVWSYLQAKHAKEFPSLESAGEWIERVGGIEELNKAIEQLNKLNTEEQPPAGRENPPEPQAGTGETSSLRVLQSA